MKANILPKLKSLTIVLSLKNKKKHNNYKKMNPQRQKTRTKMANKIKRRSPNTDQKSSKPTIKNPISRELEDVIHIS
jgi:hypothetical protein